jgi:hypothetical protein
MIRKLSTAAVLAAVFAAGLSFANAAQTETCRTIEIKAEAGHTAKATDKANADLRKQAKEMKSTVTRSTINCLPKGKDVVCRLTATVCRK